MKIQNSEHNKPIINSSMISQNTSCENQKSIKYINKIHQIKKHTSQKTFGQGIFKHLTKNSSMKTMCSEEEVKLKEKKLKIVKKCSQQSENLYQNKKIQAQYTVENNQQKHDIQIQKQIFENYGNQHIIELPTQPDFAFYTKDIVQHLLRNENLYISKNSLSIQIQITLNMRTTLIQWLIQVHFKCQLSQETLFLCINIIDRILSQKIISKSKFQLLGLTSLFIASKYEQIRAPSIQAFVSLGCSVYSKEQIISMEGKIMLALEFQMGYSSPLKFIDKTYLLTSITKQIKELSYAMVELSLLDNKIYEYKPSVIAQSAIILAYKYEGLMINQNEQHEYTNEVKDCVQIMSVFLKSQQLIKFDQVCKIARAKYGKNKILQNLFMEKQ